MKFHYEAEYKGRSFIVSDIPDFEDSDGSKELKVEVNYGGNSNVHKAVALDGHVMPVLVNAVKMKEMLQLIVDAEYLDCPPDFCRKIKALLKETEGPA